MKQALADATCDFMIAELEKAHGFKNITRQRVQAAYQAVGTSGPVTRQYSLFVFAHYFRTHPPDAVSFLGDVVRDDV